MCGCAEKVEDGSQRLHVLLQRSNLLDRNQITRRMNDLQNQSIAYIDANIARVLNSEAVLRELSDILKHKKKLKESASKVRINMTIIELCCAMLCYAIQL